ncbi:hypothetical protein D9757_009058 [Collybiopsis confluens]|uniref:TEA domain-containing protein n=1 Tax=Collybiopsis confluens TaxID=2823264 RepID=A0A8H5M5G6_9AGAR|nr:hypothetical protein D9757_009058 [Collybiopsis confluens]
MVRRASTSRREHTLKANPGAKEAAQIVLNIRKTWKNTAKSSTEKVWPPGVEAVLLEGLQAFRIDPRKEFKRFPRRNCFLAKYIKEHTGYDRTPKQVGSRLQQLRDSCKDEQVLQLLTRKNFEDRSGSWGSPSSYSSASDFSGSRSSSSTTTPYSPETRTNHYEIPPSQILAHNTVNIQFKDSPKSAYESGSTLISLDLEHVSMEVPLDCWRDPIVSLRMTYPLDLTEHYCVFNLVVHGEVKHSEHATLSLRWVSLPAEDADAGQIYIYDTLFLPQSWESILSSYEPESYQVFQYIVKHKSDNKIITSNGPAFGSSDLDIVQTIVYNFQNWADFGIGSLMYPPETEDYRDLYLPGMFTGAATSVTPDVLGLNTSAFAIKPDPSYDGRAHFPIQDLPKSYEVKVFPLSPPRGYPQANSPEMYPSGSQSLPLYQQSGTSSAIDEHSSSETILNDSLSTVPPREIDAGSYTFDLSDLPGSPPSFIDSMIYPNDDSNSTDREMELYPHSSSRSAIHPSLGWEDQIQSQMDRGSQRFQPTSNPGIVEYGVQYFWHSPTQADHDGYGAGIVTAECEAAVQTTYLKDGEVSVAEGVGSEAAASLSARVTVGDFGNIHRVPNQHVPNAQVVDSASGSVSDDQKAAQSVKDVTMISEATQIYYVRPLAWPE